MKNILLFTILILLVGCGGQDQSPQNYKKPFPPTPDNTVLETGSNFLNAKGNWIRFVNLVVGQKQTRALLFTAPWDGTLIISRSSYGLGSNCQATAGGSDYSLNYRYMTKAEGSDAFTVAIEAKTNTIQDSIKLKKNQVLQVLVEVEPLNSCSVGEIEILAIF